MTDKKTEALKLALDVLEVYEQHGYIPVRSTRDAITAIREALAEQPAQQRHISYVCPQCHWSLDKQPAQQQEQKLEFVSPGGGYVPAIPRPMPIDWKLVPRKATPEMLKAMDECAQEGYDERLYAGIASSVYMAAWDSSPVLGTLPLSEKKISMMDMIVGNLVREGINKHRARELAEHFIKQCNYTNGYCTGRTDLLAEQKSRQDEPIAWMTITPYGQEDDIWYENPKGELLEGWTYKPLYTSPQPSKPWVGLTDEEIGYIADEYATLQGALRAIEAKLREKNK